LINKESLINNDCKTLPLFIPTIYVVYQYSYKNNIKATGFGDFIRGCYFILQFSDKYKIHVDFIISNHPIKYFLEYFSEKPDIAIDISSCISFFTHNNHRYYQYNGIIDYAYKDIDNTLLYFIKQTPQYNNNKYIYLTNHPHIIKITESNKRYMQTLIKPTSELLNSVEVALFNLKLTKYNYIVVHLRLFDEHFYNNNNNKINIKSILDYITKIRQNTKDPIFLIASNNNIKQYIITEMPNIKTIVHEITHIAEPSITNNENLKNTLIEFYIMSYSNHIYSFSVYDHGSGFSKWCAITYNIPYVCRRIY
jgi:hypothetical protein